MLFSTQIGHPNKKHELRRKGKRMKNYWPFEGVARLGVQLFVQNLPAQDTPAARATVEDIRALRQKIEELEQKVKVLETNHEREAAETKSQQRIDELEQKLKGIQRERELEEEAKAAKAKEQVEALDQKVNILEHRESDQQAAVEKLKSSPTVSLGANGLVVRSGDSNFLMNIHGYMQADARFYLNEHHPAYDTFLLRRIRPIIEGNVYDRFDYRLMLDFGSGNGSSSSAGNNALLDDAYVNARLWPDLQIQVGKYKSPVGLERLQSTAELLFIETGFATQLTPNYDLGAEIHNSLFNSPVNYAIGIFNGAADAGSTDMDTTDGGKDVAGRLFFQPFLKAGPEPLRKLGFGVGGSVGHHEGALPTYKTPGQETLFTYTHRVTAF